MKKSTAWAALLCAGFFSGAVHGADAIIEDVEEGGAGKVMPRIVSQPPPSCPASLVSSGATGLVVVTFTVDADGTVRDAVVTSSPQRQLNPYALKAVGQWKFEPGTRNGQPSPFRLRATVDFSQKEDERGQRKADASPVARRRAPACWPYEIVMAGQPAWADTSFVVDYMGRPLFTVASASNSRLFARVAVAMVEASEYNPGRKGSRKVMSPASEHFQFDGEQSLDPDARRVLAELRKPHPEILNVSELAERPKVLKQIPPAYPRSLKDDGFTGQAEIEFIISRDGRVLFPRIVSATYEDFGWAASVAVSQWRFQPPQKDGRPVEVRMTIPVLFTAQKLAEVD